MDARNFSLDILRLVSVKVKFTLDWHGIPPILRASNAIGLN